MNKFFAFITLFLTLSLVFAFAGINEPAKGKPGKPFPVRQAFMEKSPGSFDAAEYSRIQQETFDWLMSESVPLSPDTIISIHVSKEDLDGIENYECENCVGIRSAARKVRIGLVKPVGVAVGFTRLALASFSSSAWFQSHGMMQAAPDGGFVWTAAAESKNATALRLHFTNFSLPPNAELYIYNMNGEAFGPYTGFGPKNDGDFWSHTVTGPIAYVQLRHFGPPSESDLQTTHFTIADIGYLGEKFLLPFMQQVEEYTGDISRVMEHCPDNKPCVEDASCYSGGAINDAKYGVAYIQWVSGAWIYYCSGGLLADNVPETQTPYFLTAHHCLSRAKQASALECYWQYWTASCHGACYDPVGAVPRTLGSDVISSSKTGDYTLLRLWEDPPSGSVFLGWTNAPVAFLGGTEMFRISHPSGMPQAYSKHVVDADVPPCGSLPRGNFIYSRDIIGATEGGSSGSPVMNLSGQVVGQLYGACGSNLGDVCDFENNATVDGAFAAYYSEVKQWLDPDDHLCKMHVHAIDLSIRKRGKKIDIIADVTIVDESLNPVADAEVTVTFSGDVSGTSTAATDISGVATFRINVTGIVSNFTLCVVNVVHASCTYDPGANVETCVTY